MTLIRDRDLPVFPVRKNEQFTSHRLHPEHFEISTEIIFKSSLFDRSLCLWDQGNRTDSLSLSNPPWRIQPVEEAERSASYSEGPRDRYISYRGSWSFLHRQRNDLPQASGDCNIHQSFPPLPSICTWPDLPKRTPSIEWNLINCIHIIFNISQSKSSSPSQINKMRNPSVMGAIPG